MNKQLLLSLSLVALFSVSANVVATDPAAPAVAKPVEAPKVDKEAEQAKLEASMKEAQAKLVEANKALVKAKEDNKVDAKATKEDKDAAAKIIAPFEEAVKAAQEAADKATAAYNETTWTTWFKNGGAKVVAAPLAFGTFFVGYEANEAYYGYKCPKNIYNLVSRVLAVAFVYQNAIASSNEDEDND
ncbi:MAG TPA: hypothetical protein VGT41_03425 [Candidatus Babeliales bacterium]|nr:hypothetical protein [Candidatus Babeliales bacterium]